ncbi:hypothetical protein JCM18237_22910 [Halorubrum luteum]
MALKKALYYGVIAIGVLFAVSIVVSVVSTILSLAWAVVSAAVSLAILLGVVYVVYKTGAWVLGDDGGTATDEFGSSRSTSSTEPADPQERLREQYVEGRISEEEFERRIARELESESVERDLDRELSRER